MASFSSYVEALVMNALFNDGDPSALQLGARYVQLHNGDPGKDGLSNTAGNSLRKLLVNSTSVSGVFTSVTDLVWTNVPSAETYSFVSVWDSITSGNPICMGSLTVPEQVSVGSTFTIPAGLFAVTLS